jgi:hypothetical protein
LSLPHDPALFPQRYDSWRRVNLGQSWSTPLLLLCGCHAALARRRRGDDHWVVRGAPGGRLCGEACPHGLARAHQRVPALFASSFCALLPLMRLLARQGSGDVLCTLPAPTPVLCHAALEHPECPFPLTSWLHFIALRASMLVALQCTSGSSCLVPRD